jgi:GDP-4-dehydro-6-deoxy-D-mannose reductase
MPACDVLVTGARGFVGRHVLARARAAGLSAAAVEGDLRLPQVAESAVRDLRPAGVVHLAATARSAEPWQALADDLAMTGAIIRAVARHAPRAPIVVTGSAAQYGMGADRPLVEEDETMPVSPYGAAKSTIERAVMTGPLALGVRIVFTRSFNHIGPGQRSDAPAGQWAGQAIAAESAGGGVIRTGDLHAIRDFLDVRDVADAYLSLLRSRAQGIVNVCSGRPVAVGSVAALVARHAAVPVTIEHDPSLDRRLDPRHVVGDPGRLRALTGWTPTIPLEDSVRDLLAACRDGNSTTTE